MYVLLMLRYDKGKPQVIPFMKDEDDWDMKIFDDPQEIRDLCTTHILARSSENIIIDIATGDIEYL